MTSIAGRRAGNLALAVALALAVLVVVAPSAGASPYVHAHRGGALATDGGEPVPRHPENTLPAFRAAAADGFVLELDVKLTADEVPVAIHDPTLDRTTNCEGRVDALTAAELRERCEVDVLGTAGHTAQLGPNDPRRARVPTLRAVLRLATRTGAEANVEIKNIPTEPDFDPGVPPQFALAVADAIKASRFPPSRLIVQSFWPPNLDVIEDDPYFALAETSLLTLRDPPAPFNEFGPAYADANDYEWVSPQWRIDPSGQSVPAYIAEAHSLGLRVVPFTVDEPGEVRDAAQLGVDAIITNDPLMARRAIRKVAPKPPPAPPPPSPRECRATHAETTAPPIHAYDPEPRAPRMFAMQFKQELRHVEAYADFRTKIECMILEYVEPELARGRPDVVAFNEDVGLMTLATGSRGAAARAIFADPETAPSCEPQGVPCGVAAALAAVRTGYSRELAAYEARFPEMPPVGATFVAGTDTFARGWMQVFSDMAKRYDVYILGSNNQSAFRESVDPSEIAEFADPDHPTPESVYVATDGAAYNEVFMWGPRNVRAEGPPMLRNVVTQNKKVPLTSIEDAIQIAPGPSTGPDAVENVRPYRLPRTEARISFATSLPAFIFGHAIGEPPPDVNPCSDTSRYYMRCVNKLGANVVMQDEANPGRWAGDAGEGTYQPLEWMRSTWRHVADPTVDFAYNVTPHMVGNLADLAFDGQTAITQRGLETERGCAYVGADQLVPEPPESDPERLRVYSGRKTEFVGLARWVTRDAPRAELRATAAKLAPGSGDELENDYVETAVVADLPFPPDRFRDSCVRPVGGGSGGAPFECVDFGAVGTGGDDRLRGGRGPETIRGRGGDDLIRGRRGADCLFGGRGADAIYGGRDFDQVSGGRGDDHIHAAGGGRDLIRCGRGDDVVHAGPRDRVAGTCEAVR